eukprot:GGOE01021898.1.p1 GENE.GGOE01021898.1~~GGOE01021898.1.p1  ORF type:complete len:372 (-),score=52.88 GGOE01021898.1:447-1562(-)
MALPSQYGATPASSYAPFLWNGGLPVPQYQQISQTSILGSQHVGWNHGQGFSWAPYQPTASPYSSVTPKLSLGTFPNSTMQYSTSSLQPFVPPTSTYHLVAPSLGHPPQIATPQNSGTGAVGGDPRMRALSLPAGTRMATVTSAGGAAAIPASPSPQLTNPTLPPWQPIWLPGAPLTSTPAPDRLRSRMLSAPAVLRPALSIPPPSPPAGNQSPPPTTLTVLPTNFFPSTATHQNYEQLRGENAQLRLELARLRLDVDALQTQLSGKQAARPANTRDVRRRLSIEMGLNGNATPGPVPSYTTDSPMMDADVPYPIVSPRGHSQGTALHRSTRDDRGDSRSSQPAGLSWPASPVKADVIVPHALRLKPIPMD